jgi:hypothetical protein
MIGARIKPAFEEEARDRQRGGQGGVLLPANLPEANSGESREQAAAAVNVSPKSVESASRDRKNGTPKLVEMVEAGEVAVAVVADQKLARAQARGVIPLMDGWSEFIRDAHNLPVAPPARPMRP